ncbi:T9SS type A sorting domain-containing protein [Candidatus Cloacimonadota bacterium]
MKKYALIFILCFTVALSAQISFLQGNIKPILIENLDLERESQLDELYYYTWENSGWSNFLKYDFFYENGLNTEIKVYWWNGSVWAYDHRQIFFYDENDNIIEVLIQIHDGGWLNYLLYTLLWENNLMIEITIQDWINLEWVNDDRTLVSYDEYENEIEDLNQSWDGYEWYDQYLFTMTYDASNLRLDMHEQHNNQGTWIDDYFNTYSYDTNENLIEDLGASNLNGTWLNDQLITYSYDANDLLETVLNQYYFMDEWWNNYQELYTYDDEILTERLTQYWEGDIWDNYQLEEFVYEEVGDISNQIQENDFRLSNYPNPFNPSTTISFSIEPNEQYDLTIYNLKGQKVKTFLINSSTDLPINSIIWDGTDQTGNPVSSGIYFYRLTSSDTESSKKMLLMK